MKRNFRYAYNALERMGVPVRPDWYGRDDAFVISAEDNSGDEIWADYYVMTDGGGYGYMDDFGVNKRINRVLNRYGLFAEWINPGCLGVYAA